MIRRFFSIVSVLALSGLLLAVSCKKEGKASSSGGGENGGGDEPELPVDDPVPFSAITILSPDTGGGRYNTTGRRFEYSVGETFKLSVKTEPENADDTLTFSASASCVKVDENGNVTCLQKGEGQVKVSSVKNPDLSAAINLKVFAKATGISLWVYEIPGAEVIYKTRERDSWDIGVGATHKYLVSVEPSDAMQTVAIASQTSGTGGAKFSISGDILTVSVPSTQTPPESPGASDKFSYLRIKATDGFVKQFTFYTQKYDPYQVKEGDYIVRYGTDKVGIEDGGYRGNGRSDTKGACVSVGMAYTSGRHSLIMYLSSENYSRAYNANSWDEPYAPKKTIKALNGKEIHGIAVPLNANKVFRSDSPDGEIWSDSKSFVMDSGNDDLPHWARSWTLEWNNDKSYMPHYALFNTCAFVALNAGNGSSYEVRPAQFFVNDVTRKPAIDLAQSNDGNTDFSDDKYWKLSEFQGRLPAVGSTEANVVGPYVTTWLFPMLGDLCCIFAGTEFSNEEFAGTTSLQVEAERRLALLKQRTGISDWNLSWWASIEYDKDHAAQFTIDESANLAKRLTWVKDCSKSTKNFVYPILYF